MVDPTVTPVDETVLSSVKEQVLADWAIYYDQLGDTLYLSDFFDKAKAIGVTSPNLRWVAGFLERHPSVRILHDPSSDDSEDDDEEESASEDEEDGDEDVSDITAEVVNGLFPPSPVWYQLAEQRQGVASGSGAPNPTAPEVERLPRMFGPFLSTNWRPEGMSKRRWKRILEVHVEIAEQESREYDKHRALLAEKVNGIEEVLKYINAQLKAREEEISALEEDGSDLDDMLVDARSA